MSSDKTSSPVQHKTDKRRFSPSAERNRDFIYKVLKKFLPNKGILLEIASGTGDHAAWIGPKIAPVKWQTTEYNKDLFPSICAHIAHTESSNILNPVYVDVIQNNWSFETKTQDKLINNVDVITCINMIHISPWEATLGLLSGAADILKKDGVLYLYGPFFQDSVETAPSNSQFDYSLRQQNDSWGIRDLNTVEEVAKSNGLTLEEVIQMPANNLSVIFRKSA
ncbi:DUF938 domain-containing protein [Kiloniella sp.]|uniref:DUF938 domain-containing protein n=1 Tax=Kiloniella sp. TaxID=1938587 RepID=UPI003B021ED6